MSFAIFLEALEFAAIKHQLQRRKGNQQIPYINHPVKVAHLLFKSGEQDDIDLLISALLHDTLEDTDTTEVEILSLFGENVLKIVKEVTDDMALSYNERKQKQIDKAPGLSIQAKKIKIADKICNVNDIIEYPIDWTFNRKLEYIDWSEKVVEGCRGVNPDLEQMFDHLIQEGRVKLKK